MTKVEQKGGKKRRVCIVQFFFSSISANAPLPSSMFTPYDPVILNELY
jgi:hypothetical protein